MATMQVAYLSYCSFYSCPWFTKGWWG